MRFNFNKFSKKSEATDGPALPPPGADPDILSTPSPIAKVLSKKVVFAMMGVVGLVITTILFIASSAPGVSSTTAKSVQKESKQLASSNAANANGSASTNQAIEEAFKPRSPVELHTVTVGSTTEPATATQDAGVAPQIANAVRNATGQGSVQLPGSNQQNQQGQMPGMRGQIDPAHVVQLTPAQQEKQQQQTLMLQEAAKARTAGILVGDSNGGSNQPSTSHMSAAEAALDQLRKSGGAIAQQPVGQPAAAGPLQDPNESARKKAFLAQAAAAADSEWLAENKKKPLGTNEIKAGSVIPAVLISGINSDLPGQIIAQVSQTVYDTRTGSRVLIPQGTKLVGTYDSGVTYGQKRALVVWQRLIFPDATSMMLKGMPGSDASGFAGFADEVDNHYMKIFGSAVAMSAFSAVAQLSQPGQAAPNTAPSMGQTMSASLGQQLGQVGSQMAQKNMAVQPTIVIRPGYLFNVMITKDLVLDPYAG